MGNGGRTLRKPSGRPKGRRRGPSRRKPGGERRCRKAATKPQGILWIAILVLKPRGEYEVRPPARVAGRGRDETEKPDRLLGERPRMDVRGTIAEAEAAHSPRGHLEPFFFTTGKSGLATEAQRGANVISGARFFPAWIGCGLSCAVISVVISRSFPVSPRAPLLA